MIGDIVERDSSASSAKEPTAKRAPAAAPKKRWGERRRPVVLDPSAKPPQTSTRPPSDRTARPAPRKEASTSASARASQDTPLSDSERMHLENIRRMQQMTPEQIEQEREEIFRSMDPNVLQSLLRRAELKEQESLGEKENASASTAQSAPQPPQPHTATGPLREKTTDASDLPGPQGASVFQSKRLAKGATLDEEEVDDLLDASAAGPPKIAEGGHPSGHPSGGEQTAPAASAEQDLGPPPAAAESTVHFPPPPEELKKYFPDLPVETEKLAWMQPIADEEEQEYSDQLVSVAPSELRFDFNGNIVTPRMSRLIEPSKGLHHHGDAPSAAGYTLPELAHLSRSSHAAQRAMAIQTVGRVLHKFRLRKFAKSSELQEGLDRLIKATRVMETLAEAADERTRNLTVRTYATEALWLANTSPPPPPPVKPT